MLLDPNLPPVPPPPRPSDEDLADNAAWLWERYPYPDLDILTIDYDDKHVEIPYGDIQHAKKLVKQLDDLI